MEFTDVVRSEDELRALMGDPVAPAVVDKTLSALDRHCLAFIARAPFVLVATSDLAGRMDISPKGDAPGFVRVLDDKTLVIPDRPGNQRFDTFRNLFQSPRVGLMFLIPGKRETLRIGGRAEVVRDAALLESLNANGKARPRRSPRRRDQGRRRATPLLEALSPHVPRRRRHQLQLPPPARLPTRSR